MTPQKAAVAAFVPAPPAPDAADRAARALAAAWSVPPPRTHGSDNVNDVHARRAIVIDSALAYAVSGLLRNRKGLTDEGYARLSNAGKKWVHNKAGATYVATVHEVARKAAVFGVMPEEAGGGGADGSE